MSDLTPKSVQRCASCGTQLSQALLACPSCHALVHRERLSQLAADADAAAAEGDSAMAATLWREALRLLPPHSSQYDAVAKRVETLTLTAHAQRSTASKWKFGGIGALVIGLLTKGKLLLVGLTKLPTLISMLAFAAVYWNLWGWKFAVAVVASIYIHEIGHIAAIKARGFTATAPMFIPGLGAFVGLPEQHLTPGEDARIGLAGPLWGLAAAACAAIAAVAMHDRFWFAVAHTGAVINLFNLTPVWSLDGSRGVRALSRMQRWVIVGVLAAAFAVTREGMLVIVALVLVWRAFQKDAPRRDDWGAFARFAALAIVLAAITKLPVAFTFR